MPYPRTLTLAACLLLVASCGSESVDVDQEPNPRNDGQGFPGELIGLWSVRNLIYVEFSAPFIAESWVLEDQRNCFNYLVDTLVPLGGGDYRDGGGGVVNLSVSSDGNALDFGFEEDIYPFVKQTGIDSSDLPICDSNFKSDKTGSKATAFVENVQASGAGQFQ